MLFHIDLRVGQPDSADFVGRLRVAHAGLMVVVGDKTCPAFVSYARLPSGSIKEKSDQPAPLAKSSRPCPFHERQPGPLRRRVLLRGGISL